MREILFRGKRLDNGEWYYGSYLFLHISSVDWTGAKRGNPEDVHYIVNDQDINYAVYPSTIGQYTGLKDKNGKRIFEGDIVRTHYANTRKTDFVEQVVFHNGRFCSLDKIPGPGNGKIWASLPDGVPHLPQDKTPYMEWCEVIGNIHDNLELLEGGASE